MKRVNPIVVVLGLICLITVGVLIALKPIPVAPFDTDDLYWAIEVDDTLQYEIRAWGNTWGGSYSNELVFSMNDTTIDVTVTQLPSFDNVSDVPTFTSDIIHAIKVACTFSNGTDLPQWADIELTSSISGCILPVGSWPTIDEAYPDYVSSWSPDVEDHGAGLAEDCFMIWYVWFGHVDDGGGWSGNVTLTDGVPNVIVWHYQHQGSRVFMLLTLIE